MSQPCTFVLLPSRVARLGNLGLLALFCLLVPAGDGVALAQQGYPVRTGSFVNDYATILEPQDAAYIDEILVKLKQVNGIEAVVVTIHSIDDYPTADVTIESFATNLFNMWGIGDAMRNDGVLILVAVHDQLVRIELGVGYDESYNDRMWVVINEHFLSDFRRGSYSQGVLSGVRALSHELTGVWPAASQKPTALSVEERLLSITPMWIDPAFAKPSVEPSMPGDDFAGFVILAAVIFAAGIVSRIVFGSSGGRSSQGAGEHSSLWDDGDDNWPHSSSSSSFDSISSSSSGSTTSSSNISDSSSTGGGHSSGGGKTGSW